jgi:hypothetical protein
VAELSRRRVFDSAGVDYPERMGQIPGGNSVISGAPRPQPDSVDAVRGQPSLVL